MQIDLVGTLVAGSLVVLKLLELQRVPPRALRLTRGCVAETNSCALETVSPIIILK